MTKILLKRGTQEKLDVATLSLGEPAFTTDTKNFYIGDGTDKIKINGTTDHSALTKLDFTSSGHTGFAPTASPTFTGLVTVTNGTKALIKFKDYSLVAPNTTSLILNNNASTALTTTGSYNTVYGNGAGTKLTSGYGNVFIGTNAGKGHQNSNGCIAIGAGAAANMDACSSTMAIGLDCAPNITLADESVFMGKEILRDAAGSGPYYSCTFLGNNIGTDLVSAYKVTAVGNAALIFKKDPITGFTNTTNMTKANDSVYIGNEIIGSSNDNATNEIVIGNSAVSNGSGAITLGRVSTMPLYIGNKQIYDGSKITSAALPAKTFVSQIYGAGNNLSLQVNSDGTPVKGFVYSPSDTSAAFEVADPNALSLTLTNAAYQVPFYCPMSATIKSVILKSRYIISVPVVTNVININLYIYESDDGISYTKKTDTQTTLCTFSSSSVANIININKVENLNITLSQGKFYLVCLQPFRTSGSDASFNASAQCNLQVFYQYQ